MDRQATFLLALGMLIAAAAVVSVTGWVLFVRDRRADRSTHPTSGDPEIVGEVTPPPDRSPSDA